MDLEESVEVADVAFAQRVEQALDGAEILHPQRDGRVLEQTARVPGPLLALPLRLCLAGDVVERDQRAIPAVLVTGKDAHPQLHIQPSTIERIVDGAVLHQRASTPELIQLVDHAVDHVAAEDAIEIGDQLVLARCGEERQRGLVDAQHAQLRHAFLDARAIGPEEIHQIDDALGPPAVEELLQTAVVLQPEGDGRQVEHGFEIGDG